MTEHEPAISNSIDAAGLREDLDDALDLLQRLRDKVAVEDQKSIDSTLAKCNQKRSSNPCSPSQMRGIGSLRRSNQTTNRYLGEVSDVSFYNSVRDLLQISTAEMDDSLPMESYERESAEMNEDEENKVVE